MSEETNTEQKYIKCTNYDGLDDEPTLVSDVLFGGTTEEITTKAYDWLLGLLDGDKGVKPLSWYETMYVPKEGIKATIKHLIESNLHPQEIKWNYSQLNNYKDHVGFWYRKDARGTSGSLVRSFRPPYTHTAIRAQRYNQNMYNDTQYGCRAVKKPQVDIRTVQEYKDYISTSYASLETVSGFAKKARKDFKDSLIPLALLFEREETGLRPLDTRSIYKCDIYRNIFGYRASQNIRDLCYVLLGVEGNTKTPKDFKTLSSLAFYHQLNFCDAKIAEHCMRYSHIIGGGTLWNLIQIQWLCFEALEFDEKCDRDRYEKIFEIAQKETLWLVEETNDTATLNGYYRRGNDAQ